MGFDLYRKTWSVSIYRLATSHVVHQLAVTNETLPYVWNCAKFLKQKELFSPQNYSTVLFLFYWMSLDYDKCGASLVVESKKNKKKCWFFDFGQVQTLLPPTGRDTLGTTHVLLRPFFKLVKLNCTFSIWVASHNIQIKTIWCPNFHISRTLLLKIKCC